MVKEYENDPLVLKETTLKLLINVFIEGVKWLGENLVNYDYPCLIMHGGGDQIVDKASSLYLHENISVKDKTLRIYTDFYHEIMNEADKDRVLADVKTWLDERV